LEVSTYTGLVYRVATAGLVQYWRVVSVARLYRSLRWRSSPWAKKWLMR